MTTGFQWRGRLTLGEACALIPAVIPSPAVVSDGKGQKRLMSKHGQVMSRCCVSRINRASPPCSGWDGRFAGHRVCEAQFMGINPLA
jgi:hypothetical protein